MQKVSDETDSVQFSVQRIWNGGGVDGCLLRGLKIHNLEKEKNLNQIVQQEFRKMKFGLRRKTTRPSRGKKALG